MAQISRPFQIGLVAVVLLAAVWLFALRGHSKSSEAASTPAPSSSAPASQSSSGSGSGASSGGSSSTYKGSAPGVAGLSNAIAKAHGAVSTSQQNAKQLAEKSAQASGTSSAGATATAPSSQSAQATPSKSASAPATASKAPSKPATRAPANAAPNRQKDVEAALARGEVVLVLFWDRKGADDVAVHNAVRSVAAGNRKLLVEEAPAGQVASFGTVTRGVAVYGTPTILIVGKRGRTDVLTGLMDSYSIQQAINDARSS